MSYYCEVKEAYRLIRTNNTFSVDINFINIDSSYQNNAVTGGIARKIKCCAPTYARKVTVS